MQIELLKNIVASIAGEKAKGIVDLLATKKNVNEFLIAKKLGLTINQTRNLLYKLADGGLVSFIRKKDSKKGGWYTYFWTLNEDKSLIKFKESLESNVEQLKKQMQTKKTERFYHCPNCDLEFNEENAMLHEYTCPECGEVLQLKDSAKEIASFEREVAKAETMLKEVDSELQMVQAKGEKMKIKRIKAEEKKKKAERASKKKKREKELKKLMKGKSKPKKKAAKKSSKKKKKR